MKYSWKRTAAFMLAMALVAGNLPANVGTGGLFDRAAITASADDAETTLVVAWADGAETHEIPYSDVPDYSDLSVTKDGAEISDYDFGIPTYDGTVGTVEVKEVTGYDENNQPVYSDAVGTVSFTATQKTVTTFDVVDYYLEDAKDDEGMTLIYDGLSKTPKFTSLTVNGVPVAEDEYILTYANNLNVATNPKRPPMINIAFTGERFTGTSGVTFVIAPADINALDIRPVSFVYDDTVKNPVFDCGIEGSALRFKVLEGWYKEQTNADGTVEYVIANENEEGAFLSTKSATGAGNYQALIESTIKTNCTGQRVIDWSIADVQYVAKTYDGEAVDLNDFAIKNLVGDYGEGAVSIAYYDAEGSSIDAPVDAGTYKAVVTITDAKNYLPTLEKEIEFEIAKKPIVVKPEKTSKSYLAETPALGGKATNPEGAPGDVIVARDKDTLEDKVKELFALETTIASDAPIGATSKIIFNEDVKALFSNYGLQYDDKVPTEFTVVKKSIQDAKVTLNEKPYVYDGQEKTPPITVTVEDAAGQEVTLVEGTDFTIDASSVTKATNAGTYTIILNADALENSNYNGTTSVQWTIDAKDITDYITEKSTADTKDAVTISKHEYKTGEQQTPTIEISDLKEVSFDEETETKTGDFTVEAAAQTKAGDYEFTVTGTGNYKGTYTGTWTIEKGVVEDVPASAGKVYDGENADADDVVIDFTSLPEDFVATVTTGEGEEAVTKNNATIEFYEYTGEPLFDEAGEYVGATITDDAGNETELTLDKAVAYYKGEKQSEVKNAGNYVAEVTVKDAGGNYSDITKLVYFPIAKRQAEIYPESGQSKEYHAEVPAIRYELEDANGDRGVIEADKNNTIDIDGNAVDWVDVLTFTDDMKADTPVGTYEIDIDVFNFNDLMNYELSCTYPVEFEVTPRSLEEHAVFVLKAVKDTFDDKPNTFKFDGTTKQVAIDYAYDKDWTVEEAGDDTVTIGDVNYKRLSADDYTTAGVVKMAYNGNYSAQAEGKGNYAGTVTSGNGLDWTIEEATATISLNADDANKTYDGEAVKESDFVVTADASYPLKKATVTYSYATEDGTVLESAPTDAGTYIVTVTATRKGYAPATASASFTIAQKEVNISIPDYQDSITYGETLPTIEKSVVGVLENEDLGLTGEYQLVQGETVINDTVPNAGTYGIKGNFEAANQNYKLNVENYPFTIFQKDIEDIDDMTVDGALTSVIADYGKTTPPAISVVYNAQTGDRTLVSDATAETYDYSVNAPTVLATGEYTIEIVGEGNYTGIREITWTVNETDEAKDAARAEIAKYVTVKAPEFVVMSESNRIIKIKAESSVDKTENPNLKLLKTGTIYYRGADLNGKELTLDTVGTVIDEGTGIAVKDVTKGTTASSVNVSDKYNGIYVRNYAIVGDGTYQAVVYTDTVKTSIEELDAKAQELKEALEKVTVSASAAIASGTTVKLSASAERGDFTNSETGVVYYRGADLNGNELTLDNVGTEIDNGMTIKSISKGTTASSVNVGDKYNGIYYRGYITVTDSDGNTHTKYTDVRFAKVVNGELTDAVVD